MLVQYRFDLGWIDIEAGADNQLFAAADDVKGVTVELVQWVISPGGSPQVNASTLLTVSIATGFLPGARVLSRSRPVTPASAYRRCQRHTAGRLTPARPATCSTGRRSAESRTMRARCTCFTGRVRSPMIASKRTRSSSLTTTQSSWAIHPGYHIRRR